MTGGWSRAKGCEIVRDRAWGICEICGRHAGQHFSHRVAAGRGGSWRPSNGVRACSRCHGWLEDHPLWAGEGGWHIRRDRRDPAEVPAFLVVVGWPAGAWIVLDDEGGREVVHADDHGLPEFPEHLPPWHSRLVKLGGRPLSTVPWVEPDGRA